MPEPRIWSVVPVGSGLRNASLQEIGDSSAGRETRAEIIPIRRIEESAATRPRGPSPERRPGQSRSRSTTVATPGSATLATRSGCANRLRGALEPGREASDHRLPVGEDVGVVPLGRSQDRHGRPVRIEVAGVLVRLHDEGLSAPPAGRRRQPTGQVRRQQGAHERRRIETG